MKGQFLFLFFVPAFLSHAQMGCTAPILEIEKISPTHNSIAKIVWGLAYNTNYNLAAIDSISLSAHSTCGSSVEEIFRNDTLILSRKYSTIRSIRCLAGMYRIGVNAYGPGLGYVSFYFTIKNPLDVGVSSNDKSSDNIRVYVNSIEEKIQVNSFGDVIKQVSLYTIESKLLETAIFENTNASVPFGNYPKGIYFMKIVLASDKVVIKKVLF